jgi:hypothetical protein
MRFFHKLRRLMPVPLLFYSALVIFTAPRAHAQPVPIWDHYKVYGVQPTVTSGATVVLRDQFVTTTHSVYTLDWFATPAEKRLSDGTGQPIFDPRTHYAWWRITEVPLDLAVAGENQFGTQSFVLTRARYLLNPALKNEQGELPLKNHYKCYECLGNPVNVGVTLLDQFGTWQAQVTIPRFFCTPTEKQLPTGLQYPIVDPAQHYVCYEITPPDPLPHSAVITDQFVPPMGVQLVPGQFLCVPTQKVEPTSAGAGTWGRVKILYR